MSLSLSADQPEQPADADDGVWLECIECGDTFAPFDDVRYTCDECDGLLEVRYADLPAFDDFEGEGVWRYADALPFESGVSIQEGATPLYEVPRLEDDIGVKTLADQTRGDEPDRLVQGPRNDRRRAGRRRTRRRPTGLCFDGQHQRRAGCLRLPRRDADARAPPRPAKSPPARSPRRASTVRSESSRSTATSTPVWTSFRNSRGRARPTC